MTAVPDAAGDNRFEFVMRSRKSRRPLSKRSGKADDGEDDDAAESQSLRSAAFEGIVRARDFIALERAHRFYRNLLEAPEEGKFGVFVEG